MSRDSLCVVMFTCCWLFQSIFELYKSEEDLIEDLHMVKTVSYQSNTSFVTMAYKMSVKSLDMVLRQSIVKWNIMKLIIFTFLHTWCTCTIMHPVIEIRK